MHKDEKRTQLIWSNGKDAWDSLNTFYPNPGTGLLSIDSWLFFYDRTGRKFSKLYKVLVSLSLIQIFPETYWLTRYL